MAMLVTSRTQHAAARRPVRDPLEAVPCKVPLMRQLRAAAMPTHAASLC